LSTVKIRTGSLFRTPEARIVASCADSERQPLAFSSSIHNVRSSCTGCTQAVKVSRLRKSRDPVQSRDRKFSQVGKVPW